MPAAVGEELAVEAGKMKQTSIFQKIIPSIINVVAVFLISLPIEAQEINIPAKRMILIGIFFLYCLFFQIFNKNEDLGMLIAETRWKENYSFKNQLIYNILYTISFATIFFHVFFVFDLLLVNIFLLQLPCILLTGTTVHGYLAGKMVTVKD